MNVESRAEIIRKREEAVLRLGCEKSDEVADPTEMTIARRMADALLADKQLLDQLFGG